MTIPASLLLTDEEMERLDKNSLAEYWAMLQGFMETQPSFEFTPRQQVAHDIALQVDELLAGGAAGGGKTEFLLRHGRWCCEQWPGVRVLLLRRSFPMLRRTVIPRARVEFRDADAIYRATDKEWVFGNNSVLEFGHLEGEIGVVKYDSAEYAVILIDEGSEFSQKELEHLGHRLRATTEQEQMWKVHLHMVIATNPGGPGHNYLRTRYVTSTDYGRTLVAYGQEFGDFAAERTIAFVPFAVNDNPHVARSYISSLLGLGGRLRRQRLYGDWDTVEGAYFDEFSAQTHVVDPEEMPILPHWRAVGGLDHGWTDPCVALWGAWTDDGNLVIFREWSARRWDPRRQARQIVELDNEAAPMSGGVVLSVGGNWYADPAISHAQAMGSAVVGMWRQEGLRTRYANNSRIDGWQTVASLIRPRGEEAPEELQGQPRLFVYSTCRNLIRSLPAMLPDRNKPDDVARHDDDHWPDALRYLVMGSHRKPLPPPPDSITDPRNVRLREDLHRTMRRLRLGDRHGDPYGIRAASRDKA